MTDFEKKIKELESKGIEYETFETTEDGYCINEYHFHTSYTEHVYNSKKEFIKKIEHE